MIFALLLLLVPLSTALAWLVHAPPIEWYVRGGDRAPRGMDPARHGAAGGG